MENTLDKKEPGPHILQAAYNHAQAVFCRTEEGNVEKEAEDIETQKMDEDWRLTDSARSREAAPLEGRWASTAPLTATSEDTVDMLDPDLTEEMDSEGCHGGDAPADTDGLSMGGVLDEGAAGSPPVEKRQEKLQEKREEAGGGTEGELSGSLPEDPRGAPGILWIPHTTDDSKLAGCGDAFSHETGGRRTLQNVAERHPPAALQPQNHDKAAAAWRGQERRGSCENYVEIFKSTCDSGVGPQQTVPPQGDGPLPVELLLDRVDWQPRLRLVSISLPVDADGSPRSSRSDSTLLSPSLSHLDRFPFLDDTTDTEQDVSEDHIYEDTGHASEGEGALPFEKRAAASPSWSPSRRLQSQVSELQLGQRQFISGLEHPSMSSSPMLGSKNHAKPLYLSRYPRSVSMEAQEAFAGVYSYMEGSPKQGGAVCFSGSLSQCSPSSSALSTPTSVVDIPPPFELAYITKRPITKSSPSLMVEEDASEKTRKKKSSIKHFLMLKFRRKTDGKPAADVRPSSFRSSSESIQHSSGRLLDPDRQAVPGSPRLASQGAAPHLSHAPSPTFLLPQHMEGRGSTVAFLNRSIVRVESFEERSRAPFMPLPLTKPRSISFPNTDTSDYENVPPISSDYENLQVPQRRPLRQVPLPEFCGRPARPLTAASETDGYVDMSSLPGFKGKTQRLEQEAERYVNTQNLPPK